MPDLPKSVVGIDPGVTTGICVLDYGPGDVLGTPWLLQANEGAVVPVVSMILTARPNCLVAIEKFVTGNGAGAKGENADTTRDLTAVFQHMAVTFGMRVVLRSAADVKLWATDKRLVKTGILTDSNKTSVRHSLDAARHALFAATADLQMPDPLIRR